MKHSITSVYFFGAISACTSRDYKGLQVPNILICTVMLFLISIQRTRRKMGGKWEYSYRKAVEVQSLTLSPINFYGNDTPFTHTTKT